MGGMVDEGGVSERPSVMGGIDLAGRPYQGRPNIRSRLNPAQFHLVLTSEITRRTVSIYLLSPNKERDQHEKSKLTAASPHKEVSGAGSNLGPKRAWESIDFKRAQAEVTRLQVRIAKAFKEGKLNKARCLQGILARSFYARVLAVRKASSNKGSRTPGIDGQLWRSPSRRFREALALRKRGYKALPLRRHYILKKNGKQRPLGIPCMKDRAMQALYAFTLEPIAESTADWNSYGFRRFRGTADAIESVFTVLARKSSPQWILEGDIKACFDEISHSWLLANIPMDKSLLAQWLGAGYLEKGLLFPTEAGTPQGGIISPIISNMVLDGLEKRIKSACPGQQDKVHFNRYADDFVVSASERALLESTVIPEIKAHLSPRGLRLSEEKTVLTHIADGFDFLGQNVRKYGDKLLIKPSNANVRTFLHKVRTITKECRGHNAATLIRRINPVIRGWANYHRHVASKGTFAYVDYQIHQAIMRWATRTHRKKSRAWIYHRYFKRPTPQQGTVFTAMDKPAKASSPKGEGKRPVKLLRLVKAADTKIVRRVKVRMTANPFDPQQASYFAMRARSKGVRDSGDSWKQHKRK